MNWLYLSEDRLSPTAKDTGNTQDRHDRASPHPSVRQDCVYLHKAFSLFINLAVWQRASLNSSRETGE